MLSFERASFQYDPFPLGVAAGVFSDADYAELVASYPADDLFVPHPGIGRRFTLSYRHNPRAYYAHVRRHRAWRELNRYIGSFQFIQSTLAMLRSHQIDLGLDRPSMVSRAWLQIRGLRHRRRAPWSAPVATEMVFARLAADGGCLLPHTDAPRKIVNIAMPIFTPGSWDATAGGGTDVNRPKDIRKMFNRTNAPLGFEDVEVLDTVPFGPNQALIVVRSDTSWHSIRPMQAAGSTAMRRSVNVHLVQPGF